MATFTWTPDADATTTREPRIREAKFGDGYSQRAQDGLNADMARWSVRFSGRSQSEGEAIDEFLAEQGGVTAFDWTPPGGTTALKWVCRKWNRSYASYESQTVSAEFQQVPA